jgi:hypothetical protein
MLGQIVLWCRRLSSTVSANDTPSSPTPNFSNNSRILCRNRLPTQALFLANIPTQSLTPSPPTSLPAEAWPGPTNEPSLPSWHLAGILLPTCPQLISIFITPLHGSRRIIRPLPDQPPGAVPSSPLLDCPGPAVLFVADVGGLLFVRVLAFSMADGLSEVDVRQRRGGAHRVGDPAYRGGGEAETAAEDECPGRGGEEVVEAGVG